MPFWDDPKWRAQAGRLWSIVLNYALLAFIPAYVVVLMLHFLAPARAILSPPAALNLGTFMWLFANPLLQTVLLVACLRQLGKATPRRGLALLGCSLLWGTIAAHYGYWGPEMAWCCAVVARCYQEYSARHPSLALVLATATHALVNVFAFATAGWSDPLVPFQPL
jgi:hypothetical protein